ncbi:hypothetical protein A3Q56_06094 [Intoshia linei]|uniref:Uncharacterized protein n=1 Tax=Intoshia linei TaxID=1819745 RepID=A0A177AX79_9BILA|nr:hypothetical protein A3Q56_06094 [Intoshia linei]
MHSDKKLKNKHKNHKNRHDLPFYQRFFQYFCICFCWKSVKYQKRTNRVYKTTNSEIIIATEHETKYPHSCITSVNRESYKFNESPKVPVKRDSVPLN